MKNGISYENAWQVVSYIKEDSFCCDFDMDVLLMTQRLMKEFEQMVG